MPNISWYLKIPVMHIVALLEISNDEAKFRLEFGAVQLVQGKAFVGIQREGVKHHGISCFFISSPEHVVQVSDFITLCSSSLTFL